MKKNYETPTVEKIAFQYRDQVVATSGGNTACESRYENTGIGGCPLDEQVWVEHVN